MNKKEEIYNGIVDVTKNTGQGVPELLIRGEYGNSVDELIEEGLLQRNYTKFSYLDNHATISLTGIYCVEADDRKNNGLSYMRHYLRIPEDTNSKVPQASEVVKYDTQKYLDFLNENLVGLEAIKNLEHKTFGFELTKPESEYLKTRDWYKDNNRVADAVIEMDGATSNLKRLVEVLEELVRLMDNDSPDIEKHRLTAQETGVQLKYRRKLRDIMTSVDKDVRVQDCFKELV